MLKTKRGLKCQKIYSSTCKVKGHDRLIRSLQHENKVGKDFSIKFELKIMSVI